MTNKLMLAAILALLSSAPAMAQESQAAFDSRWNPYLGCWTIAQDQRGQSAPVPAGTMVCVRPSGRFGVAITTTVDGKNVLEQTIVADGSAQPLSQGDCSGTQTSSWSRDGERLFTHVELECANRPKRAVSGITLLANGHWIDAQSTVIDGNSDVRLRRYRRTSDQYAAAPAVTTSPLSIEDVIEASAKVQSEALEAALDEINARFVLNSRVLTQLADNGVSRNVIDLMVAQAYPDKFQVERGGYPSSASTSYGTASMVSSTAYMGSTMYPMYDPFYSSYYYYSPFAYPYYWGPSYSYGYGSPFYRNYYNYDNYYGFPGSGYYYGVGGGSSGGGTAQPGSPDSRGGDGVVVNGRGYTRVRPAGSSNTTGSGESATPASRTTGSTRGVSAGSTDSGASSNSGASSSSSSGSSGASSGGYSGGGGGDSGGGRTAQPR
jgi:hypothetical protein